MVRLSRAAHDLPPQPGARADAPIIAALMAIVADHGRWGFWKCVGRLRRLGHRWNHKRVHRVYCDLRLNLKRRMPHRLRRPLQAPPALNRTWALDFMSDAPYDRRRCRVMTLIDKGNREALALEIGISMPAARVSRVLADLVALHGRPDAIRVDNGPEFLSDVFVEWCTTRGIRIHDIQSDKPDQNAYIERVNPTYRQEVLDAYLFESLEQVRAVSEHWLLTYNHERPHDSLGEVPPLTFLPRRSSPVLSPYRLST